MKITLIAPTFLPARRANTIQVMKMAQALKGLGHDVRVLVPLRGKANQLPTWDELAHHYGLQQQFQVEWLSTQAQLRSYDYGLISVRQARRWGADLIYTRLPQAAALASLIGVPVIYEVHDQPQGSLGPSLLNCFLKGSGARVLVVITAALREALASRFTLPAKLPLVVAPDGVDLTRYENLPTPEVAREDLSSTFHFPSSAFVVGYTGHLYPGRGINLILDMAAQLPDVSFLLVGGEPKDVEHLRVKAQSRGLGNLVLTGFVPNAELPVYQAACDLLLMPYQRQVSASSGGDIANYLSPLKLFEYLACGQVILSSDLPVLREVLNSQNAVLLPPNDVTAWVAAIRNLQNDPEHRTSLAAQAQEDALRYSWEARARKILSAFEH